MKYTIANVVKALNDRKRTELQEINGREAQWKLLGDVAEQRGWTEQDIKTGKGHEFCVKVLARHLDVPESEITDGKKKTELSKFKNGMYEGVRGEKFVEIFRVAVDVTPQTGKPRANITQMICSGVKRGEIAGIEINEIADAKRGIIKHYEDAAVKAAERKAKAATPEGLRNALKTKATGDSYTATFKPESIEALVRAIEALEPIPAKADVTKAKKKKKKKKKKAKQVSNNDQLIQALTALLTK